MLDDEKKYVFRLMLTELPHSFTGAVIHDSNTMRIDYEKGGFFLNKTDDRHIKRRTDIILKNINNIDIDSFFNIWLSTQENYQEILNPYFGSLQKDEIQTEENNNYLDSKIFNKLVADINNKNHLLYFIILSKIDFSDDQKSNLRMKFYELSQKTEIIENHKQSNDNYEEKYKISVKKNKDLDKQIHKITKGMDKLKDNLHKEKEHVKDLRIKITKLTEVAKQKDELEKRFDKLKSGKEKLDEKIKEYEKDVKNLKHILDIERKDSFHRFLDENKADIDKELELYREVIQRRIDNLKDKIKNLDETKKSLEEFNNKLKDELEDYIINGEKWKNAFRPTKLGKVFKDEDFDENLTNLKKENIDLIKKLTNDGEDRFLLYNKERIKIFKNNVFIYNIDSSFISFDRFNEGKGFFKELLTPFTFTEFIRIVKMFDQLFFALVIFNANRAPIECYFSNIINAVQENISIIDGDDMLKIPNNIVFFFQINDDEYSAKLSETYSKLIKSIV